jgi:nucleoside-specific outer membrane channel protein Tsx
MLKRRSATEIVSIVTALVVGALVAGAFVSPTNAAEFSNTELQFQYGRLKVPQFAGGGEDNTTILTVQNASGYKWGDFFGFVDFLKGDDSEVNHFNDYDAYGEMYINFSSSKLLGINFGKGLLRDIGYVQGFNFDADANVYKILPGIRLSWNIPGFAFLNTDWMAYLDSSSGVKLGTFNAPAESDSAMLDVNFATKSFRIAGQYFNFEGHVEFVAPRQNEFGEGVAWYIFGQPQFRWDAGYALFGRRDHFFIGTEYQIWVHKLGEKETNESAFQALGVWRF